MVQNQIIKEFGSKAILKRQILMDNTLTRLTAILLNMVYVGQAIGDNIKAISVSSKAYAWLGEIPSCCSSTLLLGPAWVLLKYVLQAIFSGPVCL